VQTFRTVVTRWPGEHRRHCLPSFMRIEIAAAEQLHESHFGGWSRSILFLIWRKVTRKRFLADLCSLIRLRAILDRTCIREECPSTNDCARVALAIALKQSRSRTRSRRMRTTRASSKKGPISRFFLENQRTTILSNAMFTAKRCAWRRSEFGIDARANTNRARHSREEVKEKSVDG
jgi:hypothetical protein